MNNNKPRKTRRPRPSRGVTTGTRDCHECGAEAYTWHKSTCRKND